MGGFSAHADQSELLKWFAPLAAHRPRVYLTHGEDKSREPLKKLIQEKYNIEAGLPAIGDEITL